MTTGTLRYRREAEGEVRRALDSLIRLQRARAEGLLPDEEEAAAVQHELDAELAQAPAPNEPRIEKIERLHPLADRPANGNAPTTAPIRSPPDGKLLLRNYQVEQGWGEARAKAYWDRLSEPERAAVAAAIEHERQHGFRSHPAHWYTQRAPAPAKP
jgi:hypothetical protein